MHISLGLIFGAFLVVICGWAECNSIPRAQVPTAAIGAA